MKVREVKFDGKIHNCVECSYVIVRCSEAGVHSGYLIKTEGDQVTLKNTRRLWRWWGKTLSGLAVEGTFAPDKCKFSQEIPEITLRGWCEIIPCTEEARKSLQTVKDWEND